jgi:hypothetical protein
MPDEVAARAARAEAQQENWLRRKRVESDQAGGEGAACATEGEQKIS